MKAPACLIIIISVLVLANSCEKDNPDEGIISNSELDGRWHVNKIILDGTEYNNSDGSDWMNFAFTDHVYNTSNSTFMHEGSTVYELDVKRYEINDDISITTYFPNSNQETYLAMNVLSFIGGVLKLDINYDGGVHGVGTYTWFLSK